MSSLTTIGCRGHHHVSDEAKLGVLSSDGLDELTLHVQHPDYTLPPSLISGVRDEADALIPLIHPQAE
jgi:hypothetical protein